jgi:hypothetical protein
MTAKNEKTNGKNAILKEGKRERGRKLKVNFTPEHRP